MVEHAVWLIKETGVDGFRVDAVKHMAIQFIKDLRSATDSLFANTGITFYMVGETFSGDVGLLNKYIGNDLLHAQFDFPLYFQMGNVLTSGSMGGAVSAFAAQNQFKSDLMGTFMGNHDVARAISVAKGDNTGKWGNNPEVSDGGAHYRLKQAWTMLLTNPGVPLIYYGDEYGMEGSNDPDNRRMMEFGDELNEQQKITLDYVSTLAKIRAAHPAMTRGKRSELSGNNNDSIWCYKLEGGGETVVVGIAKDGVSGSCQIGSSNVINLFSGEEESKGSMDLGPGASFQIYQVK